jgi:hypothetical protein
MNRENLLRAADYLEQFVTDEMFMMSGFRRADDCYNHICNSVGCIIGHTIAIDDWNNVYKLDGKILFKQWSHDFFGVPPLSVRWLYLFGGGHPDQTRKWAIARLRYVAENGFPEGDDIYDEYLGKKPLSYTL